MGKAGYSIEKGEARHEEQALRQSPLSQRIRGETRMRKRTGLAPRKEV